MAECQSTVSLKLYHQPSVLYRGFQSVDCQFCTVAFSPLTVSLVPWLSVSQPSVLYRGYQSVNRQSCTVAAMVSAVSLVLYRSYQSVNRQSCIVAASQRLRAASVQTLHIPIHCIHVSSVSLRASCETYQLRSELHGLGPLIRTALSWKIYGPVETFQRTAAYI